MDHYSRGIRNAAYALIITTFAWLASPSSGAHAQNAAAASDEPTTVCKNIKPLGTRMAKRVCATPEQWAALQNKTTDAASEKMRQVRGTGGVIATTPGPSATP
jgi:hypothetical protein